MSEETMRTGRVAAEAGVNIQTLRYYERRGLLEDPRRASEGRREYPVETVRIVRFIKRAQDLGFTLGEIQDLLRLRKHGTRSRGDVQRLAEQKVRDISEKVTRLQAMRKALEMLVDSCRCSGGTPECPILEALDDRTALRGKTARG